ncbi:hypothetical protein ACCC88_14295 [Sphingomonas sp. Sphisp140]|uniref:hypothetical protein n=1 Tax=unclassified Sphingomonas TaxID=196159 RepID=UPI0039AF1A46
MANLSAAPELIGAPYDLAANALLITAVARTEVTDALATAGFRVRDVADPATAPALLDGPVLDLVLLDARDAAEPELEVLLDLLAARDASASPALVAIFSAGQVDLAGPLLGMPCTQLLCDPGVTELLGALLRSRAESEGAPRARWTDITRDAEVARLRRLNEEVARIADALARLTRGELFDDEEDDRAGTLRAPEMDYRGPDEPASEIAASEIRAVIRSRRLRSQYFAAELFADPAWDMLLDLFAANIERRRVSVSSLCIAAAVPPTTALRWIGTMHEAGLFGRHADPGDRRRAYIVLSEKAVQGMRAYVGAIRRAGLGLV